jgi:hypothetical protein
MRVITKVKAAVRRARARVVDAEAVKCWECGERFPSDTKVYPFHQKMDGKKCPMSNKKVKGFEAEDTLQPIPVSGDREKDLAIAKHNAGVTRSQDRRVHDSEADKAIQRAHAALYKAETAGDVKAIKAAKALLEEAVYDKQLERRTSGAQDRRAKDEHKFAPMPGGSKTICNKCLERKDHPNHQARGGTLGKAKDTSPVFNLSPVPMPEDEHGRGRYARSWAQDGASIGTRVVIEAGWGGKGGMAGQDFKRFSKDTPAVVVAASKISGNVWVQPDGEPYRWEVPERAFKKVATDVLTPIPVEDDVVTRRNPNPNPAPHQLTSLALPTPGAVSSAYRTMPKEELRKAFGKDALRPITARDMFNESDHPRGQGGQFGSGSGGAQAAVPSAGGHAVGAKVKYKDPRTGKSVAGTVVGPAPVKNGIKGVLLVKGPDGKEERVHPDRIKTTDAAGGTYTMKEVNGKWVIYSADGKKICTYDDKAAAQHCVRLSMPNRIKSAKDAGPLTQKCMNCGMPIYKDTKYDVGKWLHGGTSQANCSGGPGSSQFPELWPKKATPKATAKDAANFKVGDKVMRSGDGPYKVVRVNENGSVEIQSIANYGHRQEPVSVLSEEKAQRTLTRATDALRSLSPIGV